MPVVLNFQKLTNAEVTISRPAKSDPDIVALIPLIVYIFFSAVATVWASDNVVPAILNQSFSKSPSDIQIFGASISMWLLHSAGLVQIFWKQAAMLRR
jgi:hypothetical protein